MALVTIVARAFDGLILAETHDASGRLFAEVKHQSLRLLTSLHGAPAQCSVEALGPFMFHFSLNEGICYLGIFDTVYPNNFAFTFLEEVQWLFREALKVEFGSGAVDYRSHVDTVEKPYRFQHLDRKIWRKVEEFRDTTTSKAIQRLHIGLTEVSNVMRCSIDDLARRGDSHQDVARKFDTSSTGFFEASSLNQASKDASTRSGSLWFRTVLRRYDNLMMLLVVIFLLFGGWLMTQDGGASSLTSLSASVESTEEKVEYLGKFLAEEPPAPVSDALPRTDAAGSVLDDGTVEDDEDGVGEDGSLVAVLGGVAAALVACCGVLARSRSGSPAVASHRPQSYSTVPIAGSFAFCGYDTDAVGGFA